MPKRLLDSIKVLDMTQEKIGYATRILADLGAEVIKVEKPSTESRSDHSPTGSYRSSDRFLNENTGKLSITLDLDKRPGMSVLMRLAKKVDVIVEDCSPESPEKMVFNYEEMSQQNKRIILVSGTYFGPSGPFSCGTDNELALAASCGQMQKNGASGSPPFKIYGNPGGFTASLYTVVAILLALQKRERAGFGQHIDISAQECIVSTLEHVLPFLFYGGRIEKCAGPANPRTGFCTLPCKDGFVLINIYHQWDTLVEWMDVDHMADDLKDEKYKKDEHRQRNFDHIVHVVSKWIKKREKDALMRQAQLMHMAWAAVQSPSQILTCPQLRYRGFFQEMKIPGAEEVINFPGLPFAFDGLRPSGTGRVPVRGEHNRDVYVKQMGFSVQEFEKLTEMGVI